MLRVNGKPVISRLFEKLIFDQLYQYMKENGMFSGDQPGFFHLFARVTCLKKNTDDWYNGLDLGRIAGLVFIELKKAFDIDHKMYLPKTCP